MGPIELGRRLSRFARDIARKAAERGAGIVEYALAVALIAVVSLTAITLVGNETEEEFDCLATELGAPEIRHTVLEKLRTDVKAFTIVEAKFRDSCL